jgi:Sigma-54 interaction domain
MCQSGLFEAVSDGTLFLDEINALPLPLQGKLFTAIAEKRVRRAGAVAAHSVDVKLIAATQAELSRHDATAASPAPCILERYVSPGGNTWHVRGKFEEFSGYFWESTVI